MPLGGTSIFLFIPSLLVRSNRTIRFMNIMQSQIDEHRQLDDGKIIQGSAHISRVLGHKSRNKIIIKTVCDLRKIANTFDSIACCGTSGLLVVPQIAEILDKHIVIVRKRSDKRYSLFNMEGVVPYRYVIVDDLVCSGNTIKLVKNTIHDECPRSICVGAYFYIPEECAYSHPEGSKLFKRDFGIPALNPFTERT